MSIETLKRNKGVDIELWLPAAEVEQEAQLQLHNIASLPWCFSHVAVMPDCHMGKGATVGSVIAMKDACSPSAVGVDIGCGMNALQTTLTASDLPDSLADIRLAIEQKIPVGFNAHDEAPSLPPDLERLRKKLFNRYEDLDPKVEEIRGKALKQCGTLGGGNHFIEICLDTEQKVWLMLHSGSRNIGNRLAELHIGRAKKLAHNKVLDDPELAVFLSGTKEMDDYRRDLTWAQEYAAINRKIMMHLLKKQMQRFFKKVDFKNEISCHHNYLAEETHFGQDLFVTRKGAISAREGELGIIPGSMGAKSFIVAGLGNERSFTSASHGAGRKMSRNKAKKSFTLEDLAEQTKGVECRKDDGVLDEIPGAYKDIEQVMANQKDLVEILFELRQVLCVKG